MLAQKIGRTVIPVVEKYTELGLILKYAEKVGVRPQIGMRVKLAARGGGRWQGSGGYRSKFGLTVAEVLRGLEELKARGMAGLLQAAALPPRQPDPQHPHRQGRAERGGARLHRARQGGRRARVPRRRRRPRRRLRRLADQLRVERQLHARRSTPTTSSTTSRRCATTTGVKHPTIVSESGRAIVAYHSVLIFNVLGVSAFGEEKIPDSISAGRGRAAADRPARDLPEPDRPQRARELPRRAAGARHGAEPVQRRLPAARSALPGREPVLGDPA